MDNKNLLLAMALSVGFLFAWSTFVVPRLAPPRPMTSAVTPAASAPSIVPAAETAVKAAHSRGEIARMAQSVYLRDEHNEIVVSPMGGGIQHWRIKSKGQEADLVLYPDAPTLPLATFPSTAFALKVEGRQIRMDATLEGGLQLTKTLSLAADGHLHTLSFRFVNPTARSLDVKNWEWGWGPGLGTVEMEHKENARLIRALSMTRLRATVLKDDESRELGLWAGMDNRYFLVAAAPEQDGGVIVRVSGKKEQAVLTLASSLIVPAHGQVQRDFRLYVGPKGYTQLKRYDLGLQESVDFGWFTFLGKPLLQALYALQKTTQNYGWAIILLTLGMNVLLLPLTVKSFRATMAMKTLQPKLAELQTRFKGDPKRLNVEMMNLYKNSGANPFGGCLPMILQAPIFVAFFNVLRNAYELRGTPFIGWIRDLSAPDKLPAFPQVHVLPLVMGVGMFFQQRLSGAATDPTQKQMMMLFPVMFTFMLYAMPSGLVLYWLTNSLCMMTFQVLFIKMHQPPATGTPLAPLIDKP